MDSNFKNYHEKLNLTSITSRKQKKNLLLNEKKRIIFSRNRKHLNKIFLKEFEKNNEQSFVESLTNKNKNGYNKIYPIFTRFQLEKQSIRNPINSLLKINKKLSETLPLIKKEKLKMKEEKKKEEDKTFSYSQNKNITPKLSKSKRNINLYEKYKKYMNYSSSKENKKLLYLILSTEKENNDYIKNSKIKIQNKLDNYSCKINKLKKIIVIKY